MTDRTGGDWDATPASRQLLDRYPGLVYRCRLDAHWTMLYASAGARELTGYLPDELVDNRRVSYESIIHEQDRDRVRREVEEAIAVGRDFEIVYRIETANHLVKWV